MTRASKRAKPRLRSVAVDRVVGQRQAGRKGNGVDRATVREPAHCLRNARLGLAENAMVVALANGRTHATPERPHALALKAQRR